jgi:hypothetical protein
VRDTSILSTKKDLAMSRKKGLSIDEQTCPSCGQPEGVPLIWGMPDEHAFKMLWEASERGEVVIAGCAIECDENGVTPDHECLECGHRWHLA